MADYTEKTVSLIYGHRKNFFELKKVLLIQKKFLCFKEIDLFRLKKNFFESTKFTVIQRNLFFDCISKKLFSGCIYFKKVIKFLSCS